MFDKYELENNFEKLFEEIAIWHQNTFVNASEISQINKLDEEIAEYLAVVNSDVVEANKELVDILIVLFVLYRRFNFLFSEFLFCAYLEIGLENLGEERLFELLENKFEVNKARVWVFENGVYHHKGEDDVC